MNDKDALKLGCEVAGCDMRNSTLLPGRWCIHVNDERGERHRLYDTNPALPAYVASLLVQKAEAQASETLLGFVVPSFCIKPPIVQIRAALVALGHEAAGEVE